MQIGLLWYCLLCQLTWSFDHTGCVVHTSHRPAGDIYYFVSSCVGPCIYFCYFSWVWIKVGWASGIRRYGMLPYVPTYGQGRETVGIRSRERERIKETQYNLPGKKYYQSYRDAAVFSPIYSQVLSRMPICRSLQGFILLQSCTTSLLNGNH